MDDPVATLRAIHERLEHTDPTRLVAELAPRTREEAVLWTGRLPGWDEHRGRFPAQVIALARLVSRRAMRRFRLAMSGDGRVIATAATLTDPPAPALTFAMGVEGQTLRVEYTPFYHPYPGNDHLAFVSTQTPPQPTPLSTTGYLSVFVPHDVVAACGGPQVYAALYVEARLKGEEKALEIALEGEWPKPKGTTKRCRLAGGHPTEGVVPNRTASATRPPPTQPPPGFLF